jgi:hypothetical protein
VQSSVGWDRRGVVTGTNMFARSVGSAVGVAIFGAIANASLTRQFQHPPAGASGRLPQSADDASVVLDPHSGVAPAVRDFVRAALSTATHHVFVGLAVLAVVMVLAVLVMPRRASQLEFD